jgi:superfamily II DNA or RNA helicase
MIGCESELLSLKSEYALICNIIALNYLILYVLRLTDECIRLAVVKLNASRKSKRELILKREQEIAVKDLLLGKNFLAVLPTGYGKSLIFTLFLLAREI